MSDFGCSYNTLYSDSLNNIDFSGGGKQASLLASINGNITPSRSFSFEDRTVVKTISIPNKYLQNGSVVECPIDDSYKLSASHNKCINSGKRRYKHNRNSHQTQSRKISPSAYSEIIRSTSDQHSYSRNRRSNLCRRPFNPIYYGALKTPHDNTRRKLSSVSERNSRYKLVKDRCSSDDTDTSIGTSNFGDYLSTLSACPSLENCSNKCTNRKLKKLLPKESKSSREKCQEFVRRNFNLLTSSNLNKTADIENGFEKESVKSSSTDLTNSEAERMDFLYSDDSLNDEQIERNAKSRSKNDVQIKNLQSPRNTASQAADYHNIKHPAVLKEELEILRRQLLFKELELRECSRVSSRLSRGCAPSQISSSPSMCHSQESLKPSLSHEIATGNQTSYRHRHQTCLIKSKESYKVPISSSCAFQYQDSTVLRQCYSPFLHASPEPQILTEHNDHPKMFYSLPRWSTSSPRQSNNSMPLHSMQLTNRFSPANCSHSVDMMSQPVESLLKYFHPAKYSSPHTAYSNSRSSLQSDISNNETKRATRFSLTSQFWSNKQINRNKGIVHNGNWNCNKRAYTSSGFSANSSRNITSRGSDLGVTPFGCTGFFIPASKMNSSRRQSDPFMNSCSRKTLDFMHSLHLPVSPENHMPFQYLSKIMKLNNDLKIIPERLTLSSKIHNKEQTCMLNYFFLQPYYF